MITSDVEVFPEHAGRKNDEAVLFMFRTCNMNILHARIQKTFY